MKKTIGLLLLVAGIAWTIPVWAGDNSYYTWRDPDGRLHYNSDRQMLNREIEEYQRNRREQKAIERERAQRDEEHQRAIDRQNRDAEERKERAREDAVRQQATPSGETEDAAAPSPRYKTLREYQSEQSERKQAEDEKRELERRNAEEVKRKLTAQQQAAITQERYHREQEVRVCKEKRQACKYIKCGNCRGTGIQDSAICKDCKGTGWYQQWGNYGN